MKRWLPILALPMLACLAGPSSAHKPSDSYLSLEVADTRIEGQWDIALRDLDYALGLDANENGEITWGEVRAKHAEIAAYALARLRLGPVNAPCPSRVAAQLIDHHSDGAYAVLRFNATCAAAPQSLAIGYRLLFDLDPQHRGLVRLEHQGQTRAGILSAEHPEQTFAFASLARWDAFLDYGEDGVRHIWTGYDHVLFLLSLLLPAVPVRSGVPAPRWQPASGFPPVFWNVVKVVTAFTLAHSITLSLAALGIVTLPARLTESVIALTVVLAALNNVWPLVHGRRWLIAFCFGLVHGFGFASVLTDLGLPPDALLPALVAFNLGVELGQLLIVCAFLPVAYALCATGFYRRALVVGGSAAVALIASVWLCERAFDLQLIGG